MLSRRQTLTFGAAAALAAGRPAFSRPARPMIVNALGGLVNLNMNLGQPGHPVPGGQPLLINDRSIADARAAHLTAVNITLGYVFGPGDPHEVTLQALDQWDSLLAGSPKSFTKVTRVADFARAHSENRIGIIYGTQNSAQVGDHLDRVDTYYGRGVRVMQITYNDKNMMGGGSVAPEDTPLTPLGHQLVEKLNAAKIMVDLSHSGRRTCLDAIAASKVPISINHTGCRALTDLPRNKTDEELRGVAEKGGFVGMYFMPFLTLDGHPHATAAADHIVHALKVCGADHVGLGTDGGPTGVDDLALYQSALEKEIAERAAAGVGAKGERPDTYPFMPELRGPTQYDKIASLLQARGVKSRVIDKVLGGNFIDYARRVWA